MRRAILWALILVPAAYASAQSTGAQLLEKFNKALNSAQTLNVTYTVQAIGGAASTYKLELAKPNLAKIDSANELIVADGTNIITYNKREKTYFKKKQTTPELVKLLRGGDFFVWLGFFDPNVTGNVKGVRSLGTKARKGVTYNAVEFVVPSGRPTTVTYYLHQTDFVARQAEVVVKSERTQDTIIFDAKLVSLGDKADPAQYAFKAPEGSRELTEDELNANKWYTDIDEAIAVAKRTNRLVMADFGTEW